MQDFFNYISEQFNATFIVSNRYELFLQGFKNTMLITVFGAVFGIVIGFVLGIVKVSCLQNTSNNKLVKGFIKIINFFIGAYLSIFRGTPIILQLMIWGYIVFVNGVDAIVIAIIGVGLNSGAYVTEIIRSGIMGIDYGQTEAGRSMGLSSMRTMRYIVLPQAIKNVLPTLGNECIALLKETSVVSIIGITDIIRSADQVKTRTMDAFFPLVSVAVMYWVVVTFLSFLIKRLERRLRKSDNR